MWIQLFMNEMNKWFVVILISAWQNIRRTLKFDGGEEFRESYYWPLYVAMNAQVWKWKVVKLLRFIFRNLQSIIHKYNIHFYAICRRRKWFINLALENFDRKL